MRFNPLGALVTLLASSIILADASLNQQVYDASPIQEDLIETFREPKNILFSSHFGGASHVNWVLTILDELSQRGHNITFVTTNLHAKFAKPYPHFNTIVLQSDNKMLGSTLSKGPIDLYKVVGDIFEFANKNFETDYPALKNSMSSLEIDVALCDFGAAVGCYEAAIATDTPYIVTEAFAMTSDTSAPYINNNVLTMRDSTTLRMGFTDRFIDMFVKPVRAMMKIMPTVKKNDEKRRKAGCNISSMESYPSVHQDNLKLVNSLYGVEAARPMGPLVEMVGPILPRKYDPLTPQLKHFLDAHKRIVYIAFGQHATSSQDDKKKMLLAILESIESGVYDGFLWAARQGSEGFPDRVTTQSGTTYHVDQMFDGLYPHHHFIQWAPQTAVVMHPSVFVFITHGGAGSFYEGLYAGKRLAVFPFFGDQFPNAHNVEQNKLGVYLDHEYSQEQMNEKIRLVGTDVDGLFQKNVNRYKALIQIHSRHGRIRAADLVEEVIFVNKKGKLPYRYEASRQMSIIKAHNIDLYVVACAIATTLIFLIIFVFKTLMYKSITVLQMSFGSKQKIM